MIQHCGIVRLIFDRPSVQGDASRLDVHPAGVLVPIGHLIAEHQRRRPRAAVIASGSVPGPHSQTQLRRPLNLHRLIEGHRHLDLVPRCISLAGAWVRGDGQTAHLRFRRVRGVVVHRFAAQRLRLVARHVPDRVRPRRVAHLDPCLPVPGPHIQGQLHRTPVQSNTGDRACLITSIHREILRHRGRAPVERLVVGQGQRRCVDHCPACCG